MRNEKVDRAVELLKEAEAELAAEGAGSVAFLGAVVRVTNEAESLTSERPSMKTSEFENMGEEVPLDQYGGDGGDELATAMERIIDESDLLPVSFLEQGVVAQRSVGRVVLTQAVGSLSAGSGWGTGFLVAPDLFLTNNHVIPNANFLNKVRFQFNFQLNFEGFDRESESFQPQELVRTNPSLDYSLVRLRPKTTVTDAGGGPNNGLPGVTITVRAGERWGSLPLTPSPTPEFRPKQSFNIVQHPDGRHKEIALQNNVIQTLFANAVRYTTDTEPGSSGSPVFDNLWRLVALHHAGGERDADGKWLNNQGIRIDRIVEDMRSHLDDAVQTELGL